MKKAIVFGSAFAVVVAGAAVWREESHLPPPFATPSADNPPRVIARPEHVELHVPKGFHVEVYAEGFNRPRFLLPGPSGEILLSDSAGSPAGAVYVLQNGKPRKIIGGLDRPYGLAFWKDYLYVGEITSIKRYKYDPKTMTAGKAEEVLSMPGFTADHWTRAVLFDRAGTKMYLAVGSGSNDSPGEPPMRAAISRFNPDGSGREIFASGLRNALCMHWYPGTSTLWASVQERDGMGDNLVPDYFTSVKQGGFYGWPYAYIGPHPDPRNQGRRNDLVKKTIAPDFVLTPAHVAVMDFLFYQGRQFPQEYRGGAFLAFHGSWNRSRRVGYEIAFVPFRNGHPSGPEQDFLTGWMLSPGRRDVWGRPVGLAELRDGSLLISDDGGRKIWRVFYTG